MRYWWARECRAIVATPDIGLQATVRDIEDIVEIGKDRKVCPYYAARSGVKQAEVGGED